MDLNIAGPSWGKYEKGIHSDNPDEAMQSAIAFQEERQKETSVNPAARRWEEDRSKEILENKKVWKQQQIAQEKAQEEKILSDLRNGGVMSGGLKPARGLIVVKKKAEDRVVGGLVLPEHTEYESNMAYVLRVGDPQFSFGQEIPAPCKEGDLVLFRKGAGLNIKINNEDHLIIRFDEVFGVVEE